MNRMATWQIYIYISHYLTSLLHLWQETLYDKTYKLNQMKNVTSHIHYRTARNRRHIRPTEFDLREHHQPRLPLMVLTLLPFGY